MREKECGLSASKQRSRQRGVYRGAREGSSCFRLAMDIERFSDLFPELWSGGGLFLDKRLLSGFGRRSTQHEVFPPFEFRGHRTAGGFGGNDAFERCAP